MSKKLTKKRLLDLIAECRSTAFTLEDASRIADQNGKFMERERQWARARKFRDTADAMTELIALRKARRSTAK